MFVVWLLCTRANVETQLKRSLIVFPLFARFSFSFLRMWNNHKLIIISHDEEKKKRRVSSQNLSHFLRILWGDFRARSIHANWKLIKLFFVQQPSNFTICNSISSLSLSALLIPDHLIGQEWPATKTRHFTVAQKREVSNWKTLKKNSQIQLPDSVRLCRLSRTNLYCWVAVLCFVFFFRERKCWNCD